MGQFDSLAVLTNLYIDLQKTRMAAKNRARTLEDPDLEVLLGEVMKLEEKAAKDISKGVKNHPFYVYWLKNVKGIGPLLSAQLILHIRGKQHTPECQEKRAKYFAKKKPGEKKRTKAFTCDCPTKEIERFSNVSKLWHYAGLHVVNGKAARRRRGQKVDWNPKLKSLCWNISKSFVMHKNSDYRKHYEKFKKKEQKKHPDLRKGHIEARARRKTVKLFLAHLFDKWYQLKGLNPPKPYAIGVLGHTNEIKA